MNFKIVDFANTRDARVDADGGRRQQLCER